MLTTTDEAADGDLQKETYNPAAAAPPKGQIPCYDPSTMQLLGHTKAMTPAEVCARVLLCFEGDRGL